MQIPVFDIEGTGVRVPEPLSEATHAAVATAGQTAIVFRQHFAPRDAALSFYGGRPRVPGHLEWPRCEGTPLSFFMQWDCRELAAIDPTGRLPKDGVLCFFIDLTWGHADTFRFVHVAGGGEVRDVEPPADLPPTYGEEGAYNAVGYSPQFEHADLPRLLPKWTFTPLAVASPPAGDGMDWSDGGVAERLIAAQDSLGALAAPHEPDWKMPPGRPYPGYPHDWRAVREFAAEILDVARDPQWGPVSHYRPDIEDADARDQLVETLRESARAMLATAEPYPIDAAPDPETREKIWAWMDSVSAALGYRFERVVQRSVNASSGYGSAGVRLIPDAWVARQAPRHALAYAYEGPEAPVGNTKESAREWLDRQKTGTLAQVRRIHAPTPNHMFGSASYVQGEAYHRGLADAQLLLLELAVDEAVAHHFGEGVLQFFISPDALAAKDFASVTQVLSAY